MNKLAFFDVKKTTTLFGLHKRVIITRKEFQRTTTAISLVNNCLLYVGPFDLVICNGITRWAKSGNFTCNIYNGATVVDYVIFLHGLCEKMEEFFIGYQLWDLKSNHKPIYLSFSWTRNKKLE